MTQLGNNAERIGNLTITTEMGRPSQRATAGGFPMTAFEKVIVVTARPRWRSWWSASIRGTRRGFISTIWRCFHGVPGGA